MDTCLSVHFVSPGLESVLRLSDHKAWESAHCFSRNTWDWVRSPTRVASLEFLFASWRWRGVLWLCSGERIVIDGSSWNGCSICFMATLLAAASKGRIVNTADFMVG